MKKYITAVLSLMILYPATGQQIMKADYDRAVSFLWPNLTNKKVFNLSVQVNWFADSSGFSYVTHTEKEKVFNKFDLKTMKASRLFDHERLAKLLTDSLKSNFNAAELPFNAVIVNKSKIAVNIDGKAYTIDLDSWQLTRRAGEQISRMERKSPDGKWIAFSKNQNLYIKSASNGEEKQLSTGGKKNYEYASYYEWGEIIEGENGERPPHFSVNWSPDSKWIQTYICDLTKGQKMYLLDWSVDSLYRARLLSYYRGSPGDTDMVYMIPVIFNVDTGEEIRLDEFRNVNATNFKWAKQPANIFIENRVRGYQQTDLYRYDLQTKKQEKVYTETSATNIDNFNSLLPDDGGEIIITSEKDGWKQLYLLRLSDKTLKPITNGSFYVNDILHPGKKHQPVLFTASGLDPNRNPYYQHAYK
ncbi:MAG: S9 family peptidase, partial [Chitinophagaceae bacterium]